MRRIITVFVTIAAIWFLLVKTNIIVDRTTTFSAWAKRFTSIENGRTPRTGFISYENPDEIRADFAQIIHKRIASAAGMDNTDLTAMKFSADTQPITSFAWNIGRSFHVVDIASLFGEDSEAVVEGWRNSIEKIRQKVIAAPEEKALFTFMMLYFDSLTVHSLSLDGPDGKVIVDSPTVINCRFNDERDSYLPN